MTEESYAVFSKKFDGYKGPTINEVEKFCFDARQRGAGGGINVKLNDYSGGSFTVNIPEADTVNSYSSGTEVKESSSTGYRAFALVCLIALLLIFGFVVGSLVV